MENSDDLGVEVVGFIVLSPEFREVRVPHRQRPVGLWNETGWEP